MQCIDYDFKGLQDPTYYVLLAYVQHAEATINTILSALQKMKRFDVINQIKDNISDLINGVSQNYRTNGISLFVLRRLMIYLFNVNKENIRIFTELSILRPERVPRAPLVLTPIKLEQNVQQDSVDSGHVTQDSLQKVLFNT